MEDNKESLEENEYSKMRVIVGVGVTAGVLAAAYVVAKKLGLLDDDLDDSEND